MPLRFKPASAFKAVGWTLVCAVLLPVLYLAAAFGGAFIPRSPDVPGAVAQETAEAPQSVRIFLVTGLLHADIALPASAELFEAFPGLEEAGLPLSHPALRYLAFGWGSRAFYTTAGSYSDITVSATLRAATGDKPVMRVTPLGDLAASKGIVAIDLSVPNYRRLISAIRASFLRDGDGKAMHLAGASIGPGDAFFLAGGHFNLFNPCNQWVGNMLNAAGIGIGIWTPTTHSLLASLRWHSPQYVVTGG